MKHLAAPFAVLLFCAPAICPASSAVPGAVRNPFVFGKVHRPLKKAVAKQKKLTLEMVVIRSGEKIAVIDGRKIGVGDSVNGYRVKAITLDYVEMSDGSRTERLFVK